MSTFEKRGVISASLIWDTFGWYVWRYHYYSAKTINLIREEWTNKTDVTLYCDLEDLAGRLLKAEAANRNERKRRGEAKITDEDVKAELDKTKDKFVTAEKALTQ